MQGFIGLLYGFAVWVGGGHRSVGLLWKNVNWVCQGREGGEWKMDPDIAEERYLAVKVRGACG